MVVALPKGAVAEPQPLLVEPWSIGRAFARTPATLRSVRRPARPADRGLRLAAVDPRSRPPVRGIAGRPDDGRTRPATRRRCRCSSAASRRSSSPRPRTCGPGRSARIVDEQANTLDVTATIVDLAVRGYLTIEEIPKEGWFGKPDWTLHRTRQGRRRPARVRADAARRAVQGRQRGRRSPSLQANVLRAAGQGGGPALRRRREARMVREASRQGPRVMARARGGAVHRGHRCSRSSWRRWTDVRARRHPGRSLGGLLLTVGAEWMPSRTAKGTAIARRVGRVPHRDRDGGDPHVALGGGAERLHAVPAVRDRVRLHGEVGEGVRGAATDAARHRRGTVARGRSSSRTSAAALDDFSVTTGGTIASTPASLGFERLLRRRLLAAAVAAAAAAGPGDP